jgi:large subunit ribosomal protein L27e
VPSAGAFSGSPARLAASPPTRADPSPLPAPSPRASQRRQGRDRAGEPPRRERARRAFSPHARPLRRPLRRPAAAAAAFAAAGASPPPPLIPPFAPRQVGRFAGRKAVVLRHFEEGTKDRKFAHCLVAGIERYPRKLTKKMGDEEKEARMSVKPFVKYVNLQHVMPTRYNLDISDALQQAVGDADLTDVKAKEALKSELKAKLQECVRAQHPARARAQHLAHALATQPARPAPTLTAPRASPHLLCRRYKSLAVAKSEKMATGVKYFFQKLKF